MPSYLVAGAGSAVLMASCSFLYDADDLRRHPPDARIADAALPPPPPDGEPPALVLARVDPPEVLEGEGSEPTGRPIPVVVHGQGIAPDASIRIEVVAPADDLSRAALAEVALEVGDTWVGAGGTLAATTLGVPVIEALGHGETLTLRLTVAQAGDAQSIDLVLVGLDELALPGPSFVTSTPLHDRYARIELMAPVRFTGSAPARLVATSEIVIGAQIDANGSSQGTPGAGGCPGGMARQPGGCGNGGGGAGAATGALSSGPGGGGGGFGGTGTAGQGGSEAGSGGMPTGDEMLSSLTTEEGSPGNRGNGGGGGGTGTLGAEGRNGGGGGGVIELSAGGTIRFTAGGRVEARGGNGSGSANGSGGGGGGGSGGAILIRAQAGILVEQGDLPLSAAGGQGGAGNNAGGSGAPGRIRVDVPGALPAGAVTPEPRRGPMWIPDLAPVVSESLVNARLVGGGARTYGVRLGSTTLVEAEVFDFDGTATVAVPLQPGMNQLCAVIGAITSTDFSKPEARNCIRVAYIP